MNNQSKGMSTNKLLTPTRTIGNPPANVRNAPTANSTPMRPSVSIAPTGPHTPAQDPAIVAQSARPSPSSFPAAASSGSSSDISPVGTPPYVERRPLNLTAVGQSLSGVAQAVQTKEKAEKKAINEKIAKEEINEKNAINKQIQQNLNEKAVINKQIEEEEEKFDREELMITDEELYFVEVLEIYTKTPEEIPEEKYKEAINYFKDDEFDIFCRIIGLSTENMDDFNELWKTFYEYDKNGFTTILAGTNSDIIVDSFIKLIDQVPSVIYDIKILNNLNKILPEDNTFPKHNKCPSVEIFDADINYYHMFKLLEIISENNR